MKWLCKIFGHRYRLLRKITPYMRECYCKRCGAKFGMNDDAKMLLPLDDELKAVHDDMLGI